MPHANRLTVGIMAIVAEEERRMISERTRSALAAAKRRGVKLGGDRGVIPSAKIRAKARAALEERAAARAGNLGISGPQRGPVNAAKCRQQRNVWTAQH